MLDQQGRRVAPLPLLHTIVSAATPIARFGSAAQQKHYLPGVVAGDTLLTAALTSLGTDSCAPITLAARDGDRWRLNGVKIAVPMAHRAAAVLVPARTSRGEIGVFIVDPKSAGVTLTRQEVTNWEAQFRMEPSGVTVGPDAVLGSLNQGAQHLKRAQAKSGREMSTISFVATALTFSADGSRSSTPATCCRTTSQPPTALRPWPHCRHRSQ